MYTLIATKNYYTVIKFVAERHSSSGKRTEYPIKASAIFVAILPPPPPTQTKTWLPFICVSVRFSLYPKNRGRDPAIPSREFRRHLLIPFADSGRQTASPSWALGPCPNTRSVESPVERACSLLYQNFCNLFLCMVEHHPSFAVRSPSLFFFLDGFVARIYLIVLCWVSTTHRMRVC